MKKYYEYNDDEIEADDDDLKRGKKTKKSHRPERPGKRAWLEQASKKDAKNYAGE